MIKCSLKVGAAAIQVEAENVKQLIQGVSFFNELPASCGKCGKNSLSFRHRNVAKNDFYELVCDNPVCGYTFSLGQHKDSDTLFPNYSKGWQPPFQKSEN